jgi:hypothetical protein
MRKKAVNQVYDVLKAVRELEKELKAAPAYLDISGSDECTKHLREARHQLHHVLNEVRASDFRNRKVAA